MRKKYAKIKKKKSILKSKIFWLSFLILICIGGSIYLFIFSPVFEIKSVEIKGNFAFLDASKIKQNVEQLLPKKLFVFQLKNIFLFNAKNISKTLSKEFIQLKKVTIHRKFPSQIIVICQERQPIANFCEKEKCYLLDDMGITFQNINATDTARILVIPVNTENIAYPNVIDANLLKIIIQIRDGIKAKLNLDSKECIFSAIKLEMRIQDGWLAIFDPQKNIEQQINALTVVYKDKIGESNSLKIDYIDVRLDKIFYKLK